MKLAKLSLAAIVAAGAMTTFASAAPLEEAIKGVDLTGMIRYRITKTEDGGEGHRFSGPLTLTIPVADNLKTVLTAKYDDTDAAELDRGGNAQASNKNVSVSQAYFQYSTANYMVNVGKMILDTPWTEGSWSGNHADGVMAFYTGVEGWTFAAAGFMSTDIDAPVAGSADTNDLYAAAAIGGMGPVNMQVWVSTMQNIIDHSVFLELSAEMAGFSLKGQVNQLKLADEAETALAAADDKGIFWAVEAGYAIEGFSVGAGYIKNDKDQPIHTLSADGIHIKAGQNLYGDTANLADAKTYFVKAGYAFDKYSFGAGYSKAKQGSDKFGREMYVEAGYDYSKNFSLYSYYSDVDYEAQDDLKQIRFQATYSF